MSDLISILLGLVGVFCLVSVFYPIRPFSHPWQPIAVLCAILGSYGSINFVNTGSVLGKGNSAASFNKDGQSSSRFWVISDRVDRRTCPKADCGVVGYLSFREGVEVIEQNDGWGRISRYYDASCSSGMIEYVEKGNKVCVTENGVVDGKIAEWIPLSDLADSRPADPAEGASGIEALVSGSDDYRLYRDEFSIAAQKLLRSGRCSESDFTDIGGWLKSTTTYRNAPVYFTYCGGMSLQNRIYLDVRTGELFR